MPLATATNPFAFLPKRGLLFAPISPVIVLAIWCQQASGQAAAFEDAVRPLIENHCITCHGPEVQKAKLRLDDLQPDLQDERIMATWVNVYDKLVTGEMPPKKRERPAQDELQPATMWLKKELHAASLEHQQKTGRVLIRRLNGTEYENTMRDLLGMNVKLKDRLPDEGRVAGFDNIGAALDVSATHQRLYQDLADKAIAAVIPTCPPIPFSDMRTGKEIAMGFPEFLGKPMLKNDALMIYGQASHLAYCRTAPVPMKGRYQVQLLIAAVGGGEQAGPRGVHGYDRARVCGPPRIA